ncbi:hypothetical protein N7454_011063 [Penicillium verhagenii]|uniref:uncharacterized protein n=1 Tax=Penicillium verhagenii TaxID=1562060 RepID=UPI0025457BE7|nr:uncharacterized protein N7466_003493 [Penicillium verhagenii]KAJ5915309.1 hypothetical protein N7454_011063 [Penicillium verhagenii]KAJ5937043.1 hypothetical protein N7466_003493 [Penicillium verhagenii]
MKGISIFFLAAFAALSSAAAIGAENLQRDVLDKRCAGFGQFCSTDSDCCGSYTCFEETHCYDIS